MKIMIIPLIMLMMPLLKIATAAGSIANAAKDLFVVRTVAKNRPESHSWNVDRRSKTVAG